MNAAAMESWSDTPVGYASNWSERHVAHAAGLGTFGLSDALITPRGAAHRCGSVVVNMSLEPTPREYEGPYARCWFHTSGGSECGVCIERCPCGAITAEGHDKAACQLYVYEKIKGEISEKLQAETPGCGLCQTKVPCQDGYPV